MDIFTKGALWDYWKIGGDEIEIWTYLQRILWGLKPIKITKRLDIRMEREYTMGVRNGQPIVRERMVIVMEEIFPELTILETRSITKTLNGKDIKVKKSKSEQKPTRNEKTSTRERFEANIESRIKTVVEKSQI
ncbi:hypothetical protein Tco_1510299 [Tanacetum coccineum]